MPAVSASKEYRGSNRRDTRAVLEARANGVTHPVQLYDVSVTGCRIDCSAFDLARGDSIVFKFSEEITVAGKVAWLLGDAAGIEFDTSLPEAIARHFRS